MIEYPVADSSIAFILSNDGKKKISLFKKPIPLETVREREKMRTKKRQKMKHGVTERGEEREIERQKQSARVRNVFPVQPRQKQ